MQAFSSNVHRGTRVAGGAIGRDSSRGPAQHNWARRGSNEGGIDRGAGRGRGVDSGGRGRGHARPRLTHFLSIPLGHLPDLRTRVSTFTSSLLANDPPIPGLHDSIVISPRRLHLTLGVMSLEEDLPDLSSISSATTTGGTQKTVSTALALLTSLRPHVLAILDNQPLRIPLEVLDIMQPHRGGARNAHVMFVGPDESEESEGNRRLKAVCKLINTSFIQAGLVEDEHRPLKLHCTLINTVYRRPRARDGKRVPFDFHAILASDAFKAISVTDGSDAAANQSSGYEPTFVPPSSSSDITPSTRARQPVQRPTPRTAQNEHGHRIDLGVYNVDEVQLCLMGSSGPEGEYVSVGGIRLNEVESGSRGRELIEGPVLA